MMRYIFAFLLLFSLNSLYAQYSETDIGQIKIFQDVRLEKLEANKNKIKNINSNTTSGTKSKRTTRSKTSKTGYTRGYRIQIFSGSDRNKANDVRIKFMTSYPQTSCYMEFLNPDFKIRVGDYTSSTEANKKLQYFKRVYPSAIVIPSKVKLR